jgi:hypothetical protein
MMQRGQKLRTLVMKGLLIMWDREVPCLCHGLLRNGRNQKPMCECTNVRMYEISPRLTLRACVFPGGLRLYSQ